MLTFSHGTQALDTWVKNMTISQHFEHRKPHMSQQWLRWRWVCVQNWTLASDKVRDHMYMKHFCFMCICCYINVIINDLLNILIFKCTSMQVLFIKKRTATQLNTIFRRCSMWLVLFLEHGGALLGVMEEHLYFTHLFLTGSRSIMCTPPFYISNPPLKQRNSAWWR